MIDPNMASFTVHGRQIRSIVTVSRHYCIGRLEDGVWGIGDIFVGTKYKNYETVEACYDTVYILHITHDTASPRLSFPGMGIPMLKIRQSRDRLIFNMGIPILVSWHLDIEMAPSSPVRYIVFCEVGSVLGFQSLSTVHKRQIRSIVSVCSHYRETREGRGGYMVTCW